MFFPLIFAQERDFPTEMVKFGPERMYIDCWVKKQTYETFKEILGSGMQYHLQVSCSFAQAVAPCLAFWM